MVEDDQVHGDDAEQSELVALADRTAAEIQQRLAAIQDPQLRSDTAVEVAACVLERVAEISETVPEIGSPPGATRADRLDAVAMRHEGIQTALSRIGVAVMRGGQQILTDPLLRARMYEVWVRKADDYSHAMRNSRNRAVREAVEAESHVVVARALKVTPQAVRKWIASAEKAPEVVDPIWPIPPAHGSS